MKRRPRWRDYFEQFAHDGRNWTWHALDEERFRAFIHAAHQGRIKLSAPQLEKLLLGRRFDKDDASDLAESYRFGRDLLKHKPRFNYMGPKGIANR